MSRPVAQGGLYDLSHTPSSVEVAEERLAEIEAIATKIAVQLEHNTLNDFPSQEDFRIWKGRSRRALEHYRIEMAFLERWLNARRHFGVHGMSASARAVVRVQVRTEAQRIAEELWGRYEPRYSNLQTPATPAVARARLKEILPLAQHCILCFKELNSAASAVGIGRLTMVELRRPLADVYNEICAESSCLRTFLRKSLASLSYVGDRSFLCALVDRAITDGLNLNPEETRRYEKIRKEQNSVDV